MFDSVLKLIILATPTLFLTYGNMNNYDLKFFYCAFILLAIASIHSTPARQITNVGWYSSFLGILLLNIALFSFGGVVVNGAMPWVLGCVMVIMTVNYCKDPQSCFKFFIIAGLINIAVFYVQTFTGYFIFLPGSPETHPGGLMGNHPRLTTYLALIYPFMGRTNLILTGLWVSVCFIGRSEVVALFAIGLVFLIQVDSWFLRVAMVGVGVSCLVGRESRIGESFDARYLSWAPPIKGYLQHPIKGFGIGANFGIPVNIDAKISNSFLQFIVCTGAASIPWLIGLATKTFKRLDRKPESMGIVALVCLSFWEYPFEIKRLWMTIIPIISFFIIKNMEENKRNIMAW